MDDGSKRMPSSNYTKEERTKLTNQIVQLKKSGRSWNEIASLTGVPRETGRSWYRRLMASSGAPLPETKGVVASDFLVDGEEALTRAMMEWERTECLMQRKERQTIAFEHGPVGITFFADQHFGSEGVNYGRCFAEARTVVETPGMYVALCGDLADNYIVGKLLWINSQHRLNTSDEAALIRLYLETVAPKLLIVLPGNHDWWTELVTGISYFAQAVDSFAPTVLYDPNQLDVTVIVDQEVYPGRIRHKWRNYSMYNATHGIEQAFRMDGAGFVWGVGAHTHASGLVREFNAGGESGLALLVGSYKVYDEYAMRLGFPAANLSTGITLIFDEYGMRGESNLERAVDFFQSVYDSGDEGPEIESA